MVELGVHLYVLGIVCFATSCLAFIKCQQNHKNPDRHLIGLLLVNAICVLAVVLLFEFWLKPDLRSRYDTIFGTMRVGGVTGVLLYRVPDGIITFVCVCCILLGFLLTSRRNLPLRSETLHWVPYCLLAFGLSILIFVPIVFVAPFF